MWGELRYSRELARLLADGELRAPRRRHDAQPVLLIPGFMAGDASMTMLRHWLRRRGHRVSMSRPVFLIGQSRGGALARSLAVREPEIVSGLVMMGSPVRNSLAVSAPMLRTVRWIARLGDLGLPGVFSSSCGGGTCCASFEEDLTAPLSPNIGAVSVHSRSDGIVGWRACLDPHAEPVWVDSSHCGMSVHPEVYRVLERVLDS
jgi:triacylglycerol lipase